MLMTLLIGATIFSVILAWLYWFAPRRFIARYPLLDDKARAEAEDRQRAILSAVATAVGATIAFSYGVYKDIDKSADEQVTDQLNRKEKLKKESVAQLDSYATRLSNASLFEKISAIYSMGDIARTDASIHNTVLQTLQLYIQQKTGQANPMAFSEGSSFQYKTILPDVQAAINVIGWRDTDNDNVFRAIDFRSVYLIQPNFHGTTGFRGTLFQRAFLYGADMRYADLRGARFDGASFDDWRALERIDGGLSSKENLEEKSKDRLAVTEREGIQSDSWRWRKYDYVANFTGSDLRKASFQGAGLQGAIFNDANLEGAIFVGTNLSRADFSNSKNINQANFDGACGEAVVFPKNFKGDVRACR